jgi:hypothetical protein
MELNTWANVGHPPDFLRQEWRKKKPQISPLRFAPVEMTIPFEDRTSRFQEKYEVLAATELSSRPEESWTCGPPKVMKNGLDPATTLDGTSPFPLSS